MSNKRNWVANIDWITILMYLILVFFGWINIYAAVYNEEHKAIFDFSQRYGKQLIWIIAAFTIALIIMLIESKFYNFFAMPVYIAMIILLILTILVSRDIKGAHSWIEIGSFRLQPSEFAKITTALAISQFTSRIGFNIKKTKDLVKSAIIIFTPTIIILLQNDTGSALVYFAFLLPMYRKGFPGWILLLGLYFIILFIASFKASLFTISIVILTLAFFAVGFYYRRWKEPFVGLLVYLGFSSIIWLLNVYLSWNIVPVYILALGLVPSSFIYLVHIYRKRLAYLLVVLGVLYSSFVFLFSIDYIFNKVLQKHQQDRIMVLLGEKEDPRGVGYNVHQSKIAIGSGGFSGKGFLQGTQTKYKFVPEQSTDFIFCTVGEEWGFVGTTATILFFIMFIWRILYMAERQKDEFSIMYGYSVAAILLFHFVVNIGMTIGLAPVIGIPLPYFSYGGSSLWGFTILLFIFIKLDAVRNAQY